MSLPSRGKKARSTEFVVLRASGELCAMQLVDEAPDTTPLPNGEGIEEWMQSVGLVRGPASPEHRLREAWEAIGRARGASASVLADLLVVLFSSDFEAEVPRVRAPVLEKPVQRPKATAAHPRAFRGTLYKPPKSASPKAHDLRPALESPAAIWELLEQLSPFADAALGLLARRGFDRARLEQVKVGFGRRKRFDPGLAYAAGHAAASRDRLAQVRWLLRFACPTSPEIGARLAAALDRVVRLSGADKERSTRILAGTLLVTSPEATLSWLETALALCPERLTVLLAIARFYRAIRAAPDEGALEFLEAHREVSEPVFAHRWMGFLSESDRGIAAKHLLAGFRIADRLGPECRFWQCPPPARGATGIGTQLEAQPLETWGVDAWVPTSAWAYSIALPGAERSFEAIPWAQLDAEGRQEGLELFGDAVRASGAASPVWPQLVKRVGRFERIVTAAPGTHRAKVLKIVRGWFWNSGEREARLVEELLAIAERLASPGLLATNYVSYVLEAFIREPKLITAVLAFDDATLLELERACKHQQSAGIIGDACADVVPVLGALAVELLRDEPGKFARTLRTAGMLPRAVRRRLFCQFKSEQPFQDRPDLLPWPELVALFDQVSRPGVPNPIPKKLRAGDVLSPSPAQEQRVREQIRSRLSAVRLDVARVRCLEVLGRGLPADMLDPAQRHAFELAGTIDLNRRGLRRFLREHFAGNREWLANHPATEGWFRRHPNLDRERWTAGVRLEAEIERHGKVVLQFEQDPLEVLRLGTYAGSCLSVGGLCDYSAAAVLLDANKQVVYARNRHGAVVARQVVAISDDDQLICFHVYPSSAAPLFRRAFRDFDLQLAATLGLKIVGGDVEVEVEEVLSQAFWFDGYWDIESSEPARAGNEAAAL